MKPGAYQTLVPGVMKRRQEVHKGVSVCRPKVHERRIMTHDLGGQGAEVDSVGRVIQRLQGLESGNGRSGNGSPL